MKNDHPLPPNAPPNYGVMLVDEWGILPELSSQHGRKIWEKTVQLYEEVLKLRALPPPQARTPDAPFEFPEIETIEFSTPEDAKKAMELCRKIYAKYRVESAPQEAGICSKCRQIKSVEPHGKGYYCADCWAKIAAKTPPTYIAEILKEMRNLGFQAHDSSWRQISKFIKSSFEHRAECGVPLEETKK